MGNKGSRVRIFKLFLNILGKFEICDVLFLKIELKIFNSVYVYANIDMYIFVK